MGRVEAVSIGERRPSPAAKLGTSGIDKRPVAGPVRIGTQGVEGDAIANRKHHGGPDQAVYAFAREDYGHWEAELGRSLRAGSFGENLTTIGVDVQGARIGERWRVGECLVEVTGVPGAYLRVIEPGTVRAGDPVDVVHVPDGDLTIGYTFRAFTTQRELLASLAGEGRLAERHRATLARRGLL